MPKVSGIGRKKKKKKVTTEVTAEGGAAAVGEVPDAEAQSKKRTRQSRKKAPPPPAPLQPPACRHFLQVLDYSRVVWASAAALENASFVLELAEERCRRARARPSSCPGWDGVRGRLGRWGCGCTARSRRVSVS